MITCGVFWAVFHSLHTPLPHINHPIYLYSNHNRDNLKHLYKKALLSAKRTIEISIYALTDPDLMNILEKKALFGVKVSLAYDAKATTIPPSLQKVCHLSPYKQSALMHRKIVVIDGMLTLLGSSNLTTTSLSIHDNLVLGVYHPIFAQGALCQKETSVQVGMQSGKLWLLPEANPDAFHALLTKIHTAKKSLCIALFTLTHPKLVDAIIEAHRRGVQVQCVLDHYTARGASKRALEALLASGVPLMQSRGQQLFHHKWARIDKKTLFLGSANWTQSAFSKNSDCLMELTPLSKEQRKFMRKIWKIIQLESTLIIDERQRVDHKIVQSRNSHASQL